MMPCVRAKAALPADHLPHTILAVNCDSNSHAENNLSALQGPLPPGHVPPDIERLSCLVVNYYYETTPKSAWKILSRHINTVVAAHLCLLEQEPHD